MRIEYVQQDQIAPLAWIAQIKNGIVKVIHGDKVDCFEKFFVEGAWDGPFEKGGFCEAEWFCGTGAKIEDDKIVFSTPTHVTYSLYSINSEAGCIISNSLPMLMAYADLRFDPSYCNYEVDFNSVLDGIKNYKKDLHVIAISGVHNTVHIHYYANLSINDENQLDETIKPTTKPFLNFSDYEKRLKNSMGSMVKNAQNKKRKEQYGIVSTISKGYDAPCCAAIFRDFGCNTAVTFSANGKYKEDSGAELARHLGYKHIIEVNANNYKNRTDMVEAQIISSGDLGSSIEACVFDDIFKHNIVLSGERGDKIWNKNATQVNNEMIFEDFVSGLGYGEHRLWHDFISVPMPLFGATAWESIDKISNSEEMKPWSIDTSYDRPIPRRIVESCGIARDAFGTKKHGAGFCYKFDWLRRIEARMSKTAAVSFRQYVKEYRRIRIILIVKYFWKMRSVYLSKLGLALPPPTSPTQMRRISNPMAASYLIPWAGNQMIDNYQIFIKRERTLNREYFNSQCGHSE